MLNKYNQLLKNSTRHFVETFLLRINQKSAINKGRSCIHNYFFI